MTNKQTKKAKWGFEYKQKKIFISYMKNVINVNWNDINLTRPRPLAKGFFIFSSMASMRWLLVLFVSDCAQHDTVHYVTMHYGTVQCSAEKCSRLQYRTLQTCLLFRTSEVISVYTVYNLFLSYSSMYTYQS